MSEDLPLDLKIEYEAIHNQYKNEIRDKDIPSIEACNYIYNNDLNHPRKSKEKATFRYQLCINKRKYGILGKVGLWTAIIGGIFALYFGVIDQLLPLNVSTILTVIFLSVVLVWIVLKVLSIIWIKEYKGVIDSEFARGFSNY